MPKPRPRSFDTSDFLDDDEVIAEYLAAASRSPTLMSS